MPKTRTSAKKIAKKPVAPSKPVSRRTSSSSVSPRPASPAGGSPLSPLSVAVVGTDGKPAGKITLPKELFAAKVNNVLMAQAVRVFLANQRQGSASTKTRGEVEGSTRKIYRQKGTGRARHGAIRAPIFVGGGIVFGPKPRDYSLILPKKMKRAALASSLTDALHEGKVIVVEGFSSIPPKTKAMASVLGSVAARPSTLLVIDGNTDGVVRAARNIEGIDILPAQNLHTYSVISHQTLVFMKEAIDALKEAFV